MHVTHLFALPNYAEYRTSMYSRDSLNFIDGEIQAHRKYRVRKEKGDGSLFSKAGLARCIGVDISYMGG